MSNLSRSILDRLVIHTSVTFDGMISAFWVEIVDHPGSAPDMCYLGGNKKAKSSTTIARDRYTVMIPVVNRNEFAAARRASVCMCVCE